VRATTALCILAFIHAVAADKIHSSLPLLVQYRLIITIFPVCTAAGLLKAWNQYHCSCTSDPFCGHSTHLQNYCIYRARRANREQFSSRSLNVPQCIISDLRLGANTLSAFFRNRVSPSSVLGKIQFSRVERLLEQHCLNAFKSTTADSLLHERLV